MNRADRGRWRSARTMADLGELVVEWLNGEIQQTPGHLGPPDPETIPLIGTLTAANRAGFVTDNSQQAGSNGTCQWEAWVTGFATDATLARLREVLAPAGLEIRACRQRRHCDHKQAGWWRCPWRECAGLWSSRCPFAAWHLRAAWYVQARDPAPGRTERLWGALERFARESQRWPR